MSKKLILTTVLISLVILILGYIIIDSLNKKNQITVKVPPKNSIVYYYGLTCPHCHELDKWIKENKIEEKVKFEKKEVWYNKENAAELQKVAEFCRLDSSSIGVPFLWADGKCYIGTSDVEKILSEKSKINK
ncbi:MAG: hypothetical protein ACPLRN_03290 [Microgenomates group bacterium]